MPTILSASQIPTSGGRTTIVGTNFGPNGTDIQVTVNGNNCTDVIFVANHTTISCEVGEGVGANLSVVVQVGGQMAQSHAFSYEGNLTHAAFKY